MNRGPADRVEINLRAVAAFVEEIPYIADDWEDLGAAEQQVLALEWHEVLAWISSLDAARDAGELTEAQEEKYHGIEAALEGAWPTLERLPFRPPRRA